MEIKKKYIIGISVCVLLIVSVFFIFNQGKSNEQVITEYFEFLKNDDIIGLAEWLKDLSNQENERMEKFGF